MEEGQKEDKKLKDERTHERKTNRTKEAKKRTKSNIQLNRKRKRNQWMDSGKKHKGNLRREEAKKTLTRKDMQETQQKGRRTVPQPSTFFIVQACRT